MNLFQNMFDPRVWQAVPFHFWSVVFFVLGCMVGSFLNVVIHRLPLEQSIVTPPSHCPHCKYSIPWYLNIPLVTWVYLRGKCNHCGAPISIRYFLVELLTGIMFLGCWNVAGRESALVALVYCVLISGLIAASFIDLEHLIIPDEINFGGALLGLLVSALLPQLHGQQVWWHGLGYSALGLAVGAGVIYAIVRAGKFFLGRLRLDLDPDSRIVFGESGLSLPPKRLFKDPAERGSGQFAVHASHVELTDRCLYDVVVGVSDHKMIIGSETFDRQSVTHLEMIAGKVLSAQKAAELFGEQARPSEIILDWIGPLRRLIGKRRTAIGPSAHIVMADGAFWLARDEILFEEMFYRKKDTILFNARRVETPFGAWNDVPVRLSPELLLIGDATFNPEAVGKMEVVTGAMTVPREAMGLGDVKFMAAIGAFLGWPAVIFSLAASSFVGAAVGVTLIAMGKRDRTARLPYGPYIALGAAIWVFLPASFHEQWLANLKLIGYLFSHFLFRTPMPESYGL